MIRHFLCFITALLFLHPHLQAQSIATSTSEHDPIATEFAPPYASGDILVYEVLYRDPDFPWLSDWFIIATGPLNEYDGGRDSLSMFNGWLYPIVDCCNSDDLHRFSIDESGFVLHTGRNRGSYQLYPAFIPRTDSIVLSDKPCRILRIIDTTILGTPTKGFVMEQDGLHRIITERFGETAILSSEGEMMMQLSSAVIRDTLFNRDTTRRLYLPLCVGNRYVYKHTEWIHTTEAVTLVEEDSVIDSRLYFHLTGEGPLLGWYRSDSTGVYQYENGAERCVLPGDVSLGSMPPIGMVSDTATVTLWPGDPYTAYRISTGYWEKDYSTWISWMEGIGVLQRYSFSWLLDEDIYELIHAVICGNEYGTLVSVMDAVRGSKQPAKISVHPNPMRSVGTITFHLQERNHVRVVLSDVLGRHLRTITEGVLPAGTQQVLLNTEGLHPGMYLITVQQGNNAHSVKLIVVE